MNSAGTHATDIEIPATDGYPLAATLHEPAGGARGLPVIVNCAAAAPRGYYGRFAAFLAQRGLRVVTYDYRGIGGSLRGPLNRCNARMQDWGELDAAGVIDFLGARQSERVLIVGHSFGGQALGLMQRNERLAGALMVAAQSGYWRHWPRPYRWGMAALWYAGLPLACRVLGHMPGRLFGSPAGLPGGVARQWAGWGRQPGYILGRAEERWRTAYATLAIDLLAYSLGDDKLAPRAAVEALLGFYPRARVEHRHVAPADVGARAIGHFGFFRERFRDTLWSQAADWLCARA